MSCISIALAAAQQSLDGDAIFLSPGDEVLVEPRLAAMREAFEGDPAVVGLSGVVPLGQPGRTRSTGTCLLRNEILDFVPSTPRNPLTGEQELADLFQRAVDAGHRLPCFDIADTHFDLDTPDDMLHIPVAVVRGGACV